MNAIMYRTKGSNINLNTDRSALKRIEHTQKNFNLFLEKLIEDPRISARMNGLDISKSTFNRITKQYFSPDSLHYLQFWM